MDIQGHRKIKQHSVNSARRAT